jgi:putative transposase
MARLPRLSVAGLPHHLIQRGNNRQEIFRSTEDYHRYLTYLGELAPLHGVAIHAYVLMSNHVHLLATPAEADGPSRMMQALGRSYVAWFNHRHGRTGTLWEGRFRSTVVEAESYFLACSRYIELNPVRAGLVIDPGAYLWSSFAHHAGMRVDPLITDHEAVWSLGNTPFERQRAYARLFEENLSEQQLSSIREATQRGWALGTPSFATQLSALTTRRAGPAKRGRPKQFPSN